MPIDRADIDAFADEVRRLRGHGERPLYVSFRDLLRTAYPPDCDVDIERAAPGTGFPDVTVSRGDRVTNWIEVKPPDVDVDSLAPPDSDRFDRYRENLPHVVLTSGWKWRLFEDGEETARIVVDPDWLRARAALTAEEYRGLAGFLDRLTTLTPSEATSYEEAVSLLASAARLIERAVLGVGEEGLPARLEEARRSFTDLMRTNPADPDQMSLEDFADALAQACTFGYLVARVEARETINPSTAWRVLNTDEHPFLKTTLHAVVAPDRELEAALKGVLRTAADAVNAAAPILAGPTGNWEHVPYVYEPFFAEYRPQDRFKYGVFYTPMEITRFQVQEIRASLVDELGLSGLTDSRVHFLDPACGTGTYLLALAEEALKELEGSGRPVLVTLRELFRDRVVGFDVSPGPAAVAQARLNAWLRSHGVGLGTRFPVYVVNFLQPPAEGDYVISRSLWAENITQEQRKGDEVKRDRPILVVFGNPPWGIRPRETFQVGEGTDDNIISEWTRGAGGAVINLYDLYVAFWRVSFRLLLERPEVQEQRGIVSFITNRSWLRGKAFGGMRSWLRAREVGAEIVDLGGDIRAGAAADDEPVFAIRAGSSIATLTFGGRSTREGPTTRFRRIRGRRVEKLDVLTRRDLPEAALVDESGTAPFALVDWGALADAVPISSYFRVHYPGVKTHRDHLVVSVSGDALLRTLNDWNALPDVERAELFNESSTRQCPGRPCTIHEGAIIRHRYRPLDDRFLYFDRRFLDRPGSISRYYEGDPDTLCLLSMDSRTSAGPVVIATNTLPGYNSFRGSYETHAFPLSPIREGDGVLGGGQALTDSAQRWAEGHGATAREVGTYILALANAPSYAETFDEALETEIVRFPASTDTDLFRDAVATGQELLRAWSLELPPLGRWVERGAGEPLGMARFEDGTIEFENGDRLEGLHRETWDLSVSGYAVMQRFLEARAQLELTVELAEQIRRVAASIAAILEVRDACEDLLERAIRVPMVSF